MSIKRYPGCAYVDTTVDALLELGRRRPPTSRRWSSRLAC
ncbi:hypothetical protein BZL30_0079 [Mycobacterium kansasii]|uniref:Uncharacterized protein n=1 Tax=Mycobacterium kansasii TaxID=1768 RepID=A0A1V3XTM4_MYCKA|nr:hypothetical protein BZL30_0079 [Mycobacterium kansasii]